MKAIILIVGLAFWQLAAADTISWSSRRGALEKPLFNNQLASYQVSSTGGIQATLTLSHLDTTPGKFTYSKWEIDRWGDPGGSFAPAGSLQAVSDATNGVGLSLWGYWGNSGIPLANGDSSSYRLTMDFDHPVRSLVLPLRGINALRDTNGNNAIDAVTVESFLDGKLQVSPSYSNLGPGILRTGNTLKGDFSNPIGSDTGRASTSDQGTALVTFPHAIDRIVLTIVSQAVHPGPAPIQDRPQNWSFSLGDITFDPAPLAERSQITWSDHRATLSKVGFDTTSASHQLPSDDQKVMVTFNLNHVATSGNKFSYSKWEIDRWGDPDGILAQPGSWQVQNSAVNDVVLGLWGFWGVDGSPGSESIVPGDKTSYQLRIQFDQPVTDLRFSLHGVNAIVSGGFNSFDQVTVDSFLRNAPQTAPTFSNLGAGLNHTGKTITADLNYQVGSVPINTDDGSVALRFTTAVDEVVLTLVTEARHPTPAMFQNGVQNWAFSVSDISFLPGIENDIAWATKRGQLVKPGFSNASATYQAASSDGGVIGTFQLDYLGTTDDKPSYSQWEIDRWGDPNGVFTAPGAWQIVSNSLNDVVFGVWGYWGTNGTADGPRVAVGDTTSYRLSVSFNRPVEKLSFILNGINALLKPEAGFNSQDIITIQSFLGSVPQGSPSYSQEGNAFTRSGNTLTGNYAVQINNGFSGQHISDQGSVKVQFSEMVDRVELILVNRADHPIPASYQNGLQTYSFSMGGLSFRYGNFGSSAAVLPSAALLPSQLVSSAPERAATPVSLVPRADGNLFLKILAAEFGQPDLSRLEYSSDLESWGAYPLPQLPLRAIDRGVEIELPANSPHARGFFRWRK